MTDEQIQSLVQLKELKEQGILSQEEFDKEKDKIIKPRSKGGYHYICGCSSIFLDDWISN